MMILGRMKRWSGNARAAVMAVIAVAAAGCGQATVEIGVDPSGSSLAVVEFFPDQMARDRTPPGDMDAAMQRIMLLIPGAVVEETRDSVWGPGYRVVFATDYQSLAGVMANPRLLPDEAPAQVRLFDSVSIEQPSPEHWSFAATVRPSLDVFREFAIDQPGVERLTKQDLWHPDWGMRVTVTLPGNIQSTNGEPTGPGTAQWRIQDLVDGGSMELTTSPAPTPAGVLPEPPGPTLFETIADNAHIGFWLVGGALGVLVVIVVVSRVRQRREENGPAVIVPGAAPGYGGTPQGYPVAAPMPAWQPHRSPTPAIPAAPTPAPPPLTPATPATPAVPTAPATPPAPAASPLPQAWAPPAAADIQQPVVIPEVVVPEAVEPEPAPAAVEATPAGWYEDPTGAAAHRWWTGIEWSDHTS